MNGPTKQNGIDIVRYAAGRARSAWVRFALAGLSGVLVLAAASSAAADPAGDAAAMEENAPAPAPATQPAVTDESTVVNGIDAGGSLTLDVNKKRILTANHRITNIDVGSGEVISAVPTSPTSLLVSARKPGTTNLIISDDAGRVQSIEVTVRTDLKGLQDQLDKVVAGSVIQASEAGGAIVLRGQVADLKSADQAAQIAARYGSKVLNFLEISGGQQVMLEVKFAEVSKSATSQLGINFGYTDGKAFGGSNIGQVSPLSVQAGAAPGQLMLGVPSPSATVSIFGTGQVGDTAFAYFIDALRQNNLMRTLAEPNLVAISGQEASFLAGGEFPIPITQGGGTGSGGTAITIEYREFGVKLNFVPVVLGDGRIRLKVSPEVSDLDFTTAVRFNGFVVPGLTSRKVNTTVELAEGQTFAIAGLLNSQITANTDVTPGLGDIPILGALFRSVRYQRKETELVVLVTPRLVAPMNPAAVTPAPGEKWRYPSELDLFANADLGGDATDTTGAPKVSGPPSKFKGEYGFQPVATQPQAQSR